MLENKQSKNFIIFDSDEVDTIDSFIAESDILNETADCNDEYQFEKIDLNKFSQDIKQSHKIARPSELGNLYKRELDIKKSGIIEPSEFIEEIQQLSLRTEETIEKLKSLHSKCSLGIVDLEHKIEFEALDKEEGQEILDILRKVIIYQRHIKDALEKYKSISQITQMIDNTFTSSQLEKLDKVEEFQASRIYTPRVFNIVERKNYPTTKLSLKTIEHELTQLINNTNSKYEKV